ncbi:MAG TPA: hypothetical protein VM327_09930 [Candidatus Thermoplasmatota archaeon]|nr:hypothetical protein [Candidatus Thermoplasmatota archaeon]
MLRPILAALVLLAALMAGCANSKDDPAEGGAPVMADTSWVARALHDDSDNHDHRDWAQHVGLSTPNFIELAHDPLGIPAFGNKTAGGYFCGGATTTAEGRRISVIHSFDTSVAFLVVDVTDPTHPVHLGDYILDHAQTYDVDITPDGKHVVIAADPSAGETPPGGGLTALDVVAGKWSFDVAQVGKPIVVHQGFRDACTGELRAGPDQTVAAGPSTILVSIEDPSNPVFESLVPSPVLGPHSVSTAEVNGVTYVGASITNLLHQGSYYQFYKLTEAPVLGTQLEPVSFVDAGQYGNDVEGGASGVALFNGHVDAEISVHPVTGKPVIYLSDWDGGLIVLDFSNPRMPLQLGSWKDRGPDNGAVHSTRSIPGLHDGRHYLLVGQEFIGHPSNRPSGWIYVLDDTDPTNVFEVGRWTLPIDVQAEWNGVELYSTHYFRAVGDTVFAAMYHGGIWAFKLDFDHPDSMLLPPSVGVFMPDHTSQQGRQPTGFYDYAPFVLDVFPYEDNNLVIYDGLSGVYSVHYDASKDMPSPEPWPANGKQL